MGSINTAQKIGGPNGRRSGQMHKWWERLKITVIIAALALSIRTLIAFPAWAEPPVLDPVPDPQIARLLQENFTLPLALEGGATSVEEREKLVAVEVTKLADLLVAQGYLEARVETIGAPHAEAGLRVRALPGPLYRFGLIRVEGLPQGADAGLVEGIEDLARLQSGLPAKRSVVDTLGRSILLELRRAAYANAALRDVRFNPDPQTGVADLVMEFETGAPMRLGEIAFSGSLRMGEDALRALVPFAPGVAYSPAAIDALRSALDQTGTFSRIRIELEPSDAAPDVVNLSVELKDRGAPLEAGVQPRFLFATMLVLVGIHLVRLTSLWSDTALRRFLLLSAVVFIGGSVVEVANRLYLFLFN